MLVVADKLWNRAFVGNPFRILRKEISLKKKMPPSFESSELDTGKRLWCSKDDSSNAIILPGERKKKKKKSCAKPARPFGNTGNRKCLKRKLMKIEEEREKAFLLKTSITNFMKYNIDESAYSLLCSSTDIGKVETALGKRRRSMVAPEVQHGLHSSQSDTDSVSSDNIYDVLKNDEHEVVEADTNHYSVNDSSEHLVCNLNTESTDDSTALAEECVIGNGAAASSHSEGQMNISTTAEEDQHHHSHCCVLRSKESAGGRAVPIVRRVNRPSDVGLKRKELPIIMMEQEIMEAVNENSVVLICGETGCGKTTQVPQFLYEAGYGSELSILRRGMIGMTQPRRVAVVATAKRVSYELGFDLGKAVGFQVRYDKKMGEKCSLKLMTDGILLREIQSDILLRSYSVIVLDEVHERNMNTDILVGMLSRVVRLRQELFEEHTNLMSGGRITDGDVIPPLKLILMSATMRVEDFVSCRRLFKDAPPVIEVPNRQFPVTVHFSKRTEQVDYVGQAYKKVMSIHRRLPDGGILIFVTGQKEVEYLCGELRNASNELVRRAARTVFVRGDDAGGYHDDVVLVPSQGLERGTDSNDDDHMEGDIATEKGVEHEETKDGGRTLHVLPLYAMLPAKQQRRVFEEVGNGKRLVVVATNVAETSLTIPGIKYVVDTGREKVKLYNPNSGMGTYQVQWISKASSAQRAGRSGRTAPGHCYRLYSPAAFSHCFPDFSTPEICRTPVEGVVLLMKSLGVTKVESFPFPTVPEVAFLKEAERCLRLLDAVNSEGMLTLMGKAMAWYPMSSRHSRTLLIIVQILNGTDYKRADLVLAYAVAVVAALSSPDPFLNSGDGSSQVDATEKKRMRTCRIRFRNPTSDALSVAHVLQSFEAAGDQALFCSQHVLHLKTMQEMSKLRNQLLKIMFSLSARMPEFAYRCGTVEDVRLAWKGGAYSLLLDEERILGQAIFAGWADRVARRAGIRSSDDRGRVRYELSCSDVEESVYLHRSSSLSDTAPEFVVYRELLRRGTGRAYMHCATLVMPDWLIKHGTSLCSFSAPLTEPKPFYEPAADEVFHWVVPSFGPRVWQLPRHGLRVPPGGSRRVRVFAYALLRGDVLPCLRSMSKCMASVPDVILRPESSCHRRVGNLLAAMDGHRPGTIVVDSCARLRETWRLYPDQMRSEISDWFQRAFLRDHFDLLWFSMQQEVKLNPRERFSKGR